MPFGYPKVPYDNNVLCRTSYLVVHDNRAKVAGLAYEYLTPTTVGTGNEPRTNNFRPDVEVPRKARSTPKEYEKTGFDKGHIAAAGNMREDGQSMSQSFFMSNMAPQYPNHNRGIWRGLEMLTRDYVVKQNRNLFVISGTAYVRDPVCLKAGVKGPSVCGEGDVWIPDGFFKVIIDKDKKDTVAFYIPHQEGQFKKLVDYRIGLCDLEKVLARGSGPINMVPTATAAEKQAMCSASGSTFPERIK